MVPCLLFQIGVEKEFGISELADIEIATLEGGDVL